MANTEFHLKNLSGLGKAAAWLIKASSGYKLLAFFGEMGAGKTTLIQEICRQLGVDQDVTSPTFALVNEYFSDKEHTIFHFDFYRLDTALEVLDIGLEDYISSGYMCMFEWPEKIGPYLPDDCLRISIEVLSDNSRNIKLEFPE